MSHDSIQMVDVSWQAFGKYAALSSKRTKGRAMLKEGAVS